MNTAIRIRPLPTHPINLPATQEARATRDILGPQDLDTAPGDSTPHALNHPPTLLVHAEGGETLLNRDAVVSQLQLHDDAPTRVPSTLVVYVLDPNRLDVSLRTLHFLYGQLQSLHYQKKDGSGNNLAEIAANTLSTDRALYTAIAQELFGRSSLARRHYKVLFSATNLSDRSIQSLKNANGIKGRSKKVKTKEINSPSHKITDLMMNSAVEHEKTAIASKQDAASPPPLQEASSNGDIHPTCKQSPPLSARPVQRTDNQLCLSLTEENA